MPIGFNLQIKFSLFPSKQEDDALIDNNEKILDNLPLYPSEEKCEYDSKNCIDIQTKLQHLREKEVHGTARIKCNTKKTELQENH